MPYLAGAKWYYRDGRDRWIWDKKAKKTKRYALNEHACAVKPVEPKEWLRVKVFPLEPKFYQYFGGESSGMSLPKSFDKISFRTSFEEDKQYLLLDGLSCGEHGHFDGNSIIRLTAKGRIWLVDCDYIKSLPKFHNSVLVFKDGESQTIPKFCQLEHLADLGRIGFPETAVKITAESTGSETSSGIRKVFRGD